MSWRVGVPGWMDGMESGLREVRRISESCATPDSRAGEGAPPTPPGALPRSRSSPLERLVLRARPTSVRIREERRNRARASVSGRV